MITHAGDSEVGVLGKNPLQSVPQRLGQVCQYYSDRHRDGAPDSRPCLHSHPSCRLATAMYLQFLEDVVDVVLHSPDFDGQTPSDLLVRESLVNEPDDLLLTHGQAADLGVRLALRGQPCDAP